MRPFQIRRLAKKGEEMLTAARVSVAGDEVTAQMWTPAVLPVVPRGEEDSDEMQSGEGSSGVRRPWGFAAEQSERRH
jgi:hypothetical protein